jgi:hypothetical protein
MKIGREGLREVSLRVSKAIYFMMQENSEFGNYDKVQVLFHCV